VQRGTSGDDWYSVNVPAGKTLTSQTSTPADGPNQFTNTLNPHLELYDPSGVLVVSGTVLADGRNEKISTTLAAGNYRARVSTEAPTATSLATASPHPRTSWT
jgi:pre-peptidase